MNKRNNDQKIFLPTIRFKQKNNSHYPDWEEEKLKILAKRVNVKNKSNAITRVLTNSAAYGIVDQQDYFDKDIANKDNLDSYFIVENGDYVYNPRVSNIAPVGPISKNKIGIGVMSPLYTVFRFKNNSNDFYEQYFKSTHWHHYLRTISNSGARHDRMSITNDDFMNMPLPAPKPEEQQKIADCLSSVDEYIVTQSQKIKSLHEYKKGLILQLFPTGKDTVPKVRFGKFKDSGEWNISKLGEHRISTFVKDKILWEQLNQENYISTENLLPNYAGIKIASQLPATGSFIHFKKGDILISNIRPYLKKIWLADKNGASSNDIIVIRANSTISNVFLGFLLKSENFINYVMQGVKGVKMPRGDISLIKKYPILFPKAKEQQKIADCLTSLDELITAETQKLEVLKTHKKGLMQQLFPATKEISQ